VEVLMIVRNILRVGGLGVAALFVAASLIIFAAPVFAQIQPNTPAPSLTPKPLAPSQPGAAPQDAAPSMPAPPPAPAATPATLAKGKAIVLAGAKATGGDTLKTVKSVEVHVSGSAFTGQGPMNLRLKLTVVFPDRLRNEAELPVGTITQGFDGKAAWVLAPQGLMDLPEDFNPELARGIALTGGWGMYQSALDGKVTAQFLDDEDFDGKKTNLVLWSGPSGGIRLYFDAATHLLIGAHFRAITPQGDVETDQHWSDFRAVEGLQYPFHNQVDHDGKKFTETTVSDVKININPDPGIFARPAEEKAPGSN
jgi:hypothetical protein